MTKRRSSISGRGAEILLGDPAPVEIEPRGPTVADLPLEALEPEADIDLPADRAGGAFSAPELEELLADADLEKALREEAQAGEAVPEGEEVDLSALDAEAPPTPEMEMALFEEAAGADELPEPVAEPPTPTLEATMEEQVSSQEAAVHAPPPPETGDVPQDLLPPRPAQGHMDLGEMEAVLRDIQEPEEPVTAHELPDLALTDAEKEQILARLGAARLSELEAEIDGSYAEVRRKVGENESIATDCYNKLLKARDIVVRRDAGRIAQAEYYVEQVQARLKRATESEAVAKRYQWWILGWGALWGVAFVAVLIFLNYDWFRGRVIPPATGTTLVDMDVFLSAMLWGGIGGVVAVWYSLFKHVGRRDFDSQYIISYFGKPFLGLILGATVYMIFNLVIRTLGILPAGLEGATNVSVPSVAPGVIYIMSWASGFKENRIFDLVDRVMKRLFSGEEAKAPPAPEGAEPAA